MAALWKEALTPCPHSGAYIMKKLLHARYKPHLQQDESNSNIPNPKFTNLNTTTSTTTTTTIIIIIIIYIITTEDKHN